jgi:hypothetical protein
MDTSDDEGYDTDDSLGDVLSRMGSDCKSVAFDAKTTYVKAPSTWDFLNNDASWHALWYTVDELREQGIRYMTCDREQPFLSNHKALFRAKELAIECNQANKTRPPTCGHEFRWPVVWKNKRAYHYNQYVTNEDIDERQWEETYLRRGNAISYKRDEAISGLASTWQSYWHIGDIPSYAEVETTSGISGRPTPLQERWERDRKARVMTQPLYAKNRDKKALAANKLMLPVARVKYWLTDTGCGYDLVSQKHVRKIEDRIKKSKNPLTFNTANGATEAEDDILLRLNELDEEIEPYVMASTPAVLSVGRRCLDFGYEFRWPAGKLPYFITPAGVKVTLIVEDYIPYLRTDRATRKTTALASLGATANAKIEAATALEIKVKAEADAAAGSVKDEPQDDNETPVATVREDVAPEHPCGTEVIDDQGDLIDLTDEPDLVEPPSLSKREQLKIEATSASHLRDHLPKNPYCPSCQVGKMIRRSHGKKRDIAARPTKFGEQITADHLVAESEISQSFLGDKEAVVVYDRATRWKECYPVPTKSGDDAYISLNHFVGPDATVKSIWTDGSKELKYAVKRLGWNPSKSTPGISQTNSVAERQVRDVQAGTRTLLHQAGLPACFWNYAAPAYCFGTNTKSTNGEPSAYALRFPTEGEWPHEFIPFGARVHFMRTKTLTGEDKPAKFAPIGAVGILLGYRLHPGGKWRHEYEVAELPEFADLDLAYNSKPKQMRKIRVQTVQEVRLPEEGITFPLKAHYEWRNSTLGGVKSGRPPPDPPPHGNVEPLIVQGAVDDDEIEVGTSFLIAEHQIANGRVDPPSGGSTPPTEIATPPEERASRADLAHPVELRPDTGATVPGGGENQPSKKRDALHGDDTDDEYVIDKRGHKHRKDEFGQRVRKSGRPPFIPSGWWDKMSHVHRLQATLDYEKSKKASAIEPTEGTKASGSGGTGYPKPKPSMTCVSAAPMGIYGMLLKCTGVEESLNQGEETNAPGSEADDLEFPNGYDFDEDDFDVGVYEPYWSTAPSGECENGVPAMPTVMRQPQPHRDHIPTIRAPFNAAVARSVKKKEMYSNPKAQEAVRQEWDRLRAKRCWSEGKDAVREWKDVAHEARTTNTTVHVGRLCCICVEKGSELKEDDPKRKFKGRVVFLGNNVKDQNWDYAVFQELSSCPATMEGSRSADCYGCLPGNDIMQADAEQAYIQAQLTGIATWVELPREEWPEEWVKRGMIRPVCPLHLALYGHPDSGGHWEAHCEAHLASVGFERIPDWHSTFWHPEHKLFLIVYVDDFKLSGPADKLQVGWDLIQKGITLEKPEPLGLYLGCMHRQSTHTLPDGTSVRMIEYDMEEFFGSCVDLYKSLAPQHFKITTAHTPFPPDSKDQGVSGNPHSKGGPQIHCPWCLDSFPADLNVPHKSAKKAKTPDGDKAENPGGTGVLQPYAAKVLMKMLYGARLARFDLLRAINHLAGYITKWTPDCDKRLHRIMCYVHTSLHYRMVGFVGDKPQQLSTHLFADADFAGCPDSQRSTSGMHLAIRGPATCFPIAGASKRQTCVSHSTPEAELVAADFALRTAGLPALQLWDVLLQRHAGLVFHEDNQAMIRVCETGRNPTMRHLGRTHRVSVARMHEIFKMPDIHLTYEATHRQSADIYTKGFTEPAKWYAACLLVNIVDGKKLKQLLTNFTIHKFEKEQEDILALFPDPLRKKAIPHDLFNYVAAPSVQRRGGHHKRHHS